MLIPVKTGNINKQFVGIRKQTEARRCHEMKGDNLGPTDCQGELNVLHFHRIDRRPVQMLPNLSIPGRQKRFQKLWSKEKHRLRKLSKLNNRIVCKLALESCCFSNFMKPLDFETMGQFAPCSSLLGGSGCTSVPMFFSVWF